MNALFADDFGLVHFFHSVHFLVFLQFYTPNFTESALTNHVLAIKMFSIDLFIFKNESFLSLLLGVEF